jgi:hypothetical protein
MAHRIHQEVDRFSIASIRNETYSARSRCISLRSLFSLGSRALAIALALPDGGQLIACYIMRGPRIARRYWNKADIAHKIDLRIMPVTDALVFVQERLLGREQATRQYGPYGTNLATES